MLEKLKSILFYAGIDRSNYELVVPKIRRSNNVMTSILSAFATVLILAMYISSFYSDGIRQNRCVYGAGLILSVLTFILSLFVARKHMALVTPLVYLSYSIYYLYGIFIGAVTDPSNKTVTFMVMLVFMPVLFISTPIHSALTTLFYVAIFIVLCFKHKTGAILSVDSMDAVVFGILGIASGGIVNRMKVKGYVLERQLQEISRIDQLTQMNNQNSYKLDLHSISERCRHSLACVYVDANGLHGLNNTKGHAEGDRMLQCIAREILEHFGSELSYRIGGDEFIVFVPDPIRENLAERLGRVVRAVESDGYSVAVGYEISNTRHHFSVEELVKAADFRMQEDKRLFHDRYDR